MKNKITKNLIILGAIIFSFVLTNGVSAYSTNYAFNSDPVVQYNPASYAGDQGYSQYSYYEQTGYNPVNQFNYPYPSPYNNNQGYPEVAYNPMTPQINTVSPYNPINPINPINPVYPNYQQYSYYQQSVYNPIVQPVAVAQPQPKPNTSIVNNYYQTAPAPATVAKTSTTTVDKNTIDTTNKNTTTNDTNGVYSNSLGASAYNGTSPMGGNGITALSLRGSGGFMPSSIWQWILVVILILVIIVISRMFINKRTVVEESHTTSHSH